jgi:hypothetical protein
VSSFSLGTSQNYTSAVLEFDGSNFRLITMSPISLSLLGGLIPLLTPPNSSYACTTGALASDSNFLYFCTGPNTWKRAAWSSF